MTSPLPATPPSPLATVLLSAKNATADVAAMDALLQPLLSAVAQRTAAATTLRAALVGATLQGEPVSQQYAGVLEQAIGAVAREAHSLTQTVAALAAALSTLHRYTCGLHAAATAAGDQTADPVLAAQGAALAPVAARVAAPAVEVSA
jgi:hypothetical protein